MNQLIPEEPMAPFNLEIMTIQYNDLISLGYSNNCVGISIALIAGQQRCIFHGLHTQTCSCLHIERDESLDI